MFTDCSKESFSSVDLRRHFGGHPRLGAVDLIPVHPLTPELSVADCGALARELAETLAENVADSSFFVFGPSKSGKGKSLVERRKEVRSGMGEWTMKENALWVGGGDDGEEEKPRFIVCSLFRKCMKRDEAVVRVSSLVPS